MYTAHDLQTHLLDLLGGTADTLAVTKSRRALQEAYRRLATEHQWLYYLRLGRLVTQPSQTTGTVVYDHTGGTYERMLTLTGATWPTDAAYGSVIINNVSYRIATRESSTVVTLEEGTNPGADVSSTSYEYVREKYALPANVSQISDLYERGNILNPLRLDAVEWLAQRTDSPSSDPPRFYAVLPDDDTPGRMALVLQPAPDNAYSLDYVYRLQPTPISLFDVNSGTVTCSASTTVTGTGFTSSMVGSVLRFGTTTAAPTDASGESPYQFEAVIRSVTNSTTLVLKEAAPATYTSVKYRISDILDVEPGAMLTALMRGAEFQMAVLMSRDDIGMRKGLYDRAVVEAKEADARRIQSRGEHYPLRFVDVTINL